MNEQEPTDPDPNSTPQPPRPVGPTENPFVQQGGYQPPGDPNHVAPRNNNTMWIVIAVLCGAMFIPVLGCCVGLLLPAVQQAREAARRMSCSNNMRQIGLALHNYHAAYGSLPPAYTTDRIGTPLHSWRSLILPFMEQEALYDRIDFSKPWNDPANFAVRETVIPQYACPSINTDSTMTTYVAVLDPSGIMWGPNATKFGGVTDGLSNTVMVVECDSGLAVPWMQPDDMGMEQFLNMGSTSEFGGHQGGAHIMMADGAIQFVSHAMDAGLRRALISKAGGEAIDTADVQRQPSRLSQESDSGQIYLHRPTGAQFSRPTKQYVLATGSAAKRINPESSAVVIHNGNAEHGERMGILIVEPMSGLGPEPPTLDDLAMSLVELMEIENKTLEDMGTTEINGISTIRYVVSGDVEGTGRLRYSCLLFERNEYLFQVIALGVESDAKADDPQFQAIHESLRF